MRTGPLAMHPSVRFASLAKGYVNKEWRFLSHTPLCRLSEKKNSGCMKCLQSNFLVSEKELFGRCHHQLFLAALLLYPSRIKEGPERRVLRNVPLGGTPMILGSWSLLGWIRTSSGFLSWIYAPIGAHLGWVRASWRFLGLRRLLSSLLEPPMPDELTK